MDQSPTFGKSVGAHGSKKEVPSRFRVFESRIRKITYPLLGMLVCLQILIQLPQFTEFRSINPEIERIRLKGGGGLLDVRFDYTYTTNEFEITPLFQKIYGTNYLVIHHQIVAFLGESGAIQYVQFPSHEEALRAKERLEDSWKFERPMAAKVYDKVLVRVSGPENVFVEYSEAVFAGIQRNLESKRI
ncbi:MAG: hypothetical protein H6751_02075 [Candidatus Omnitrophica bacterium]|nr:hypothetical protein [Candidatus Omnitrophota bacterium]